MSMLDDFFGDGIHCLECGGDMSKSARGSFCDKCEHQHYLNEIAEIELDAQERMKDAPIIRKVGRQWIVEYPEGHGKHEETTFDKCPDCCDYNCPPNRCIA